MQNQEIESYWTWNVRGFSRPPFNATANLKKGLAVIVCTYKRAVSLARFLESLAGQERLPDELIIVDASPLPDSEKTVLEFIKKHESDFPVKYVRVSGALRGLTRQRNFGISMTGTDLACFFDDDVVLRPNNLALLEEALRQDETAIASAGYLESEVFQEVPRLWRLRKTLGLWREDQVGFLTHAGIAVPQSLWPPFQEVRPVDIVPGGATCWRTWVLRRFAFDESFKGYGLAEDLEYSLRTRSLGKKLTVGEARVLHLCDQAARVSSYEYGKQGGAAAAVIFRRYAPKNLKTRLRFFLSQLLDIFILVTFSFREPSSLVQGLGRLVGLLEQLRENN